MKLSRTELLDSDGGHSVQKRSRPQIRGLSRQGVHARLLSTHLLLEVSLIIVHHASETFRHNLGAARQSEASKSA